MKFNQQGGDQNAEIDFNLLSKMQNAIVLHCSLKGHFYSGRDLPRKEDVKSNILNLYYNVIRMSWSRQKH